MIRRSTVFAVVACIACGEEPTAEPVVDPLEVALDADINQELRAGGLPAASVAIIKNDRVAFVRTYGAADVDKRIGATNETIYLVASISKTFIATTLLQLVEDGVLDLDAPLDDYLPYPVRHPDHPDIAITARMLMTHTAGLRDDWIQLGHASGNGDSPITLREFSEGYVTAGGRFNNGDNWRRTPGTRRSYCNAAFGVLGDLVETASGRSLPDLSRERIFEPLGLESTGWHLREVDATRLATPYAGTWTEGFTRGKHQGFGFYPATGLRTTITDLARYLHTIARGGTLEGVEILKSQSVASMRELQVPELSNHQALVWRYRTMADRRFLGHSGSTVGGAGVMGFDPDTGVGLVVITNSDAYIRSRFGKPEGADAIDEIVRLLDGFADSL